MLLEPRRRNRLGYLLAFGATIGAGLASRRFPQLFPVSLGKYPGDALWALMVFFGTGVIFPTASTLRVAAGALVFSFAIEGLKLWQVPWLAELRRTAWGHLIFGQVFSWQNLPAYTLGILAGLGVELALARHQRRW